MKTRRRLMLMATFALALTACTSDDHPEIDTATGADAPAPTSSGPTGASAPTLAAGEPHDVRIVAEDFAYPEVPDQIPAGVVDLTFVNAGSYDHEATLTSIGDTPLGAFVDDLAGRSGLEGSAFPEYIDRILVPPFVSAEGGSTDTARFTLPAGRYVLWCSVRDVIDGEEVPHYQLGMMREVEVVGSDAVVPLPEADGRVTARDYAFDVDVEAGDRTVNFLNVGPEQFHLSTVGVYPPGVTAREAEEAYRTELLPGHAPEGTPGARGVGFAGIYSPGLGSTFELFDGEAFKSGRTYVFACFASNLEGGPPHDKGYGMYAIVTIA